MMPRCRDGQAAGTFELVKNMLLKSAQDRATATATATGEAVSASASV